MRVPDVAAHAGHPAAIRIEVSVAVPYHVQANPASDPFLIPFQVQLEADTDIQIGPAEYPSGKDHRLEGTETNLAVYDGTFDLVMPLQIPQMTRMGWQTLRGRVHHQACDERGCLAPNSVLFDMSVQVSVQLDRDDG